MAAPRRARSLKISSQHSAVSNQPKQNPKTATHCRSSQHWVDFHPTTRTPRVSGTPVEGVVRQKRVTHCRSSQPWVELGDLGSNWVEMGGGVGWREIARIAGIAKHRRN